MGLQITVNPGAPTPEGLAIELWLRSRQRVRVDSLSVVGLCPRGTELGPTVLVPLPTRLLGERRLQVTLRLGAVTPARVCCRVWLLGASEPVVAMAPVVCAVSYPGLPADLAACLDEVCIDHDEDAFQMFVGDFCRGVDPDDMGYDAVEAARRGLLFED